MGLLNQTPFFSLHRLEISTTKKRSPQTRSLSWFICVHLTIHWITCNVSCLFAISEQILRHTVDEADQRKVHTPDCSSQDNSDEDDEATLREQLLKSLAVKRKAKVLLLLLLLLLLIIIIIILIIIMIIIIIKLF